MGLNQPETRSKLAAYVARVADSPVEITETRKLSGGAIQENWALDVVVERGSWAGAHQLVLRQDSATQVAASRGRSDEFYLLKAAHAAGVRVPTPCFLCEDPDVLGRPFFLMHRLAGTAAGHRLTKADDNPDLIRELAENLARIHTILPTQPGLAFLGTASPEPALQAVRDYRAYLDAMGAQRPAIEYGLAWLQENAPTSDAITLCHRDYRTGNLMVDDNHLSGILDWEFAGWGDPLEDIGWFMAKCWRFGANHKEAGGLGARDHFYAAYEHQAGQTIDRTQIQYWEVMAHVRWATIACQQAARHRSGAEVSLELALTGYVVPELEYEILQMTGAG
ncbi:MAG: phosphotransferase family protein [Rhodospirillales bacterium]|nr:phosphotransferase family protein [Rhodospirillales bacterium]